MDIDIHTSDELPSLMDVIIIGLLFILECLDDLAVDTVATENKLIGD